MFRRFATLATLALLAFATLPALATSHDCDDAQAAFWSTWEEEAHEPTRAVALAARAVVDACPEQEPQPATTESGSDPINDLNRRVNELAGHTLTTAKETLFGKPGHIKTHAETTQAALCGFTTATQSGPQPTTLEGWMMVGPVIQNGTESATGGATFDAVSGYVHFNSVGTTWGVDTDNRGSGTLYWHGIPFPVSSAKNDIVQAKAGCGVPASATLCWGSGYGNTYLPFGAIGVAGYFWTCN